MLDDLWRLFKAAMFVIATMAALLMAILYGRAHAVPAAPKNLRVEQCPGLPDVSSAAKGSEQNVENGLVAVLFDLDRDGKPDVAHFFVPTGTDTHSRFPLFYQVDTDGDNEPDVTFVDRVGDGKCQDIVVYDSLSTSAIRQTSETALY